MHFCPPLANKHSLTNSHEEGLLINPYYVAPVYRGNGLGGKLLRLVINDSETGWSALYAVVKADNIASVRTLEKLNFQKIGYSEKRGWAHKLTANPTHLLIFFLHRE